MNSTVSIMSMKDILTQQSDDCICIDVRTPAEYRTKHIKGAVNIPLADLLDSLEALQKYSNIYVHCKSGARTEQACKKLADAGIDCVYKIEGGIDNWKEGEVEFVYGKQTISIQRQVQITAGSLILLGVVLGYTVHPNWFGLSGFVGAGLLFAGLSNTCAMAAMLSRMPWNK